MKSFDYGKILILFWWWGSATAVIIFLQETWEDWFLWSVVVCLLLCPVVGLLIEYCAINEAKDESNCSDGEPEESRVKWLFMFIAFICLFPATAGYINEEGFWIMAILIILIIQVIDRFTGLFDEIEEWIGMNKSKKK